MFKSLILILFAVAIGVSGQLALKTGVSRLGRIGASTFSQVPELVTAIAMNPFIVSGLALYGLGAAVWIVVLSRVDLSLAYPMLGLSYVFVLIFSWLLLGEHVSPLRWMGTLLIITGVVLVSRS